MNNTLFDVEKTTTIKSIRLLKSKPLFAIKAEGTVVVGDACWVGPRYWSRLKAYPKVWTRKHDAARRIEYLSQIHPQTSYTLVQFQVAEVVTETYQEAVNN